MSRLPRRVDQLIPSIIEHDAVSNHTFEAQRLLREMGFESEIFAAVVGPGAEGRVRPVADLASLAADTEDWLIYQSSVGSPVVDAFLDHRGPRMLDYHNITPAHLVERWIPPLAAEARLGREQLAALAGAVRGSFADSPYNAAELAEAGYVDPTVVPVLVEPANRDAEPDAEVLARLRGGRGATWLFVGQVAPHKAQHDLVGAFACFRECFDPDARLAIVGREMGHAYRDAVARYVRALGLEEAVEMPGSVPVASLAAYYEGADAFVCCSDHEGFSAPITEAMARGLPIVAYAAAAVPGTVGDGGVLLDRKDPLTIASAVAALIADGAARATLVAAGQARAATLSVEAARATFRATIEAILSRP